MPDSPFTSPISWQIKKIDFNEAYSLLDYRKLFYQQRFNNFANEELPLVRDMLNLDSISEENLRVFRAFRLFDLMDRKFIHLSSGELRKLLIIKSLLDNPFIGLDEASRELLNETFGVLLSRGSIQLLFLAPLVEDLPTCLTHILEIKEGKICYPSLGSPAKLTTSGVPPAINWDEFTLEHRGFQGDEMVSMTSIDITYGERIIQKDINWTIKKDENWALLEPNGSGKSTLLSYIFADNPMAYTKDIRLFGRKRGTGESIWDIKRRIGFTSSEMHLYYRKNVDCLTVVASGFFNSIGLFGLFRQCTEQQALLAEKLLKILHILHLKNRPFL